MPRLFWSSPNKMATFTVRTTVTKQSQHVPLQVTLSDSWGWKWPSSRKVHVKVFCFVFLGVKCLHKLGCLISSNLQQYCSPSIFHILYIEKCMYQKKLTLSWISLIWMCFGIGSCLMQFLIFMYSTLLALQRITPWFYLLCSFMNPPNVLKL